MFLLTARAIIFFLLLGKSGITNERLSFILFGFPKSGAIIIEKKFEPKAIRGLYGRNDNSPKTSLIKNVELISTNSFNLSCLFFFNLLLTY